MRRVFPFKRRAGYALLMVLVMVGIAAVILAGTMNRTYSGSRLNDRSRQYVVGQNAAEAALEKCVAQLRCYFVSGGMRGVLNGSNFIVQTPRASEDPYWSNFEFSDGQGHVGCVYMQQIGTWMGQLSAYPGLSTISNSPVYRLVCNVRQPNGYFPNLTNALQEEVLLAYIPVFQFAIFYNGLLEFTKSATFSVNGRVHANGAIYTGSGSQVTFNGLVTTTATQSSPAWAGLTPPYSYTGSFNGGLTTNSPSVTLPLTNTHAIIEIPPASESLTNTIAAQRLYNEANVILLVSNTSVTLIAQASVNGQIPAADPSKQTRTYTNGPSSLSTNFAFLTITNRFTDQREDSKTVLVSQVDMGKLTTWLLTNPVVLSRFPSNTAVPPSLIYIADNRTYSSTQLPAVRLNNGAVLPSNNGYGLSVATPNPLYVWGNYNCGNNTASTNTSASVPAALFSDALTILSSGWSDSLSGGSYSSRNAQTDTIDAAIVAGNVLSTGAGIGKYSGGVHNLPRLLEDWTSDTLWLNTSIVNFYASAMATNQLIDPGQSGQYYAPPTRQFNFDLNFLNPARQPPPGTPYLNAFVRKNWAVPPPNTVTYNVTP